MMVKDGLATFFSCLSRPAVLHRSTTALHSALRLRRAPIIEKFDIRAGAQMPVPLATPWRVFAKPEMGLRGV